MARGATWVTAIAVAIGASAGVALAWVSLPIPVGCGSPSSGQTPLGSPPLAFGTPNEKTVGSDHWYNFSVASAGGGLQLNNLNFRVQTWAGVDVLPHLGWAATMLSHSGNPVGTYVMYGAAGGDWTAGGATPLLSGETFSLLAAPQNLSGDRLGVVQTGSTSNGCPTSGSLTASIP
jgi:hypothetical protein